MRCKSLLLLGALLSLSTSALPSPASVLQLKERVNVPSMWEKRSDLAPSPTSPITLRIALVRSGMDSLEARLAELGDPSHPDFRQWLNQSQLNAYLSPSPESKRAVSDWLVSSGIPASSVVSRSPTGDSLSVVTTVSTARSLLGDASFNTYVHRDTGEHIVRTEAYWLPSSVHSHVDLVHPSTNFGSGVMPNSGPSLNRGWVQPVVDNGDDAAQRKGQPAPQLDGANARGSGVSIASQSSVPKDCILTYTTRACIQSLYHTPNNTIHAPGKSSLAIASYLEEYANVRDYIAYEQSQVPAAYQTQYRFKTKLVNGGINNQSIAAAGGEANLDTQATLLSYPIPTTVYNVGGRGSYIPDPSTTSNTNEPYAELFETLLSYADAQLPTVVSNSYDDSESSVSPSYAARVCKDIAALSARGVTVVFSSGDAGVGGKNTCTISGRPAYIPNFPSSCPYGVSVGATQRYAPEEAVGSDVGGYFSGGGFSNLFPQPKYQATQVNAYIKSLDPALTPFFNASGRGYPDVSAQGSNYLVRLQGAYYAIGGTSASAPTFSSVIALVNDALIAKGLKPLGYMNPFLYQRGGAQGLNDITAGSSAGCSELGSPANLGFPAKKGWDAVTGLGTPNFPELARLAGADV